MARVGGRVCGGRPAGTGAAAAMSELSSSAGRWSGYWRWVRYPVDQRRIWIRRTRCRPCQSSHALLPDFLFARRLDEVATIGQVLALRADGEIELRALARRFDLPRETLRGWWDRFRARSPTLLAEVVEVAIGLDAAPLDLRQQGRRWCSKRWTRRSNGHVGASASNALGMCGDCGVGSAAARSSGPTRVHPSRTDRPGVGWRHPL